MNHQEEQQNELQALQEIYYKEIEVLTDKTPISFIISIKPENCDDSNLVGSDGEGDDDDSEDSSENDGSNQNSEAMVRPPPLSVSLKFELPPTYPEVKPIVQVMDQLNLDEFDIQELLVNLDEKAEESIGQVMIFTLVSDVIEWLFTKTERITEQINEVREQKVREQEIEDKKRFEGTIVTVESFLAWKAKFDAEMAKLKVEKTKMQNFNDADQQAGGKLRLTGREMFEQDKSLIESDLNFDQILDQDQIESFLQQVDDLGFDDNEFAHHDDGDDFKPADDIDSDN